MKSIVIFGAGNVATHLFNAFSGAKNFKVTQVYNHNGNSLEFFKNKVNTTTYLNEVVPAEIYLLALKDEAIPAIAKKIIHREALVLHTSGATPLSVLEKFEQHGVLYPLQTFSKKRPVDFSNVPLCIEANSEIALREIAELAEELSQNIYNISSEQRKALHVAAVFVSNFVNFLYTEGEEICRENEIPFEILHPLILETASKITDLSPTEAQTGPAKRRDMEIIKSHLEQLHGDRKKIYQLLTESIHNLHGKKL